jgi:hypothetical protein
VIASLKLVKMKGSENMEGGPSYPRSCKKRKNEENEGIPLR